MANETVDTLSKALKTTWPQSELTNHLYEDAAALALMPKDTGLSGENLVVAVRFAHMQGRSANFAKAQSGATGTQQARFTVTFLEDYGTGTIEGPAIRRAKKGKGSLIDGLDSLMKEVMLSLKRSLSVAIYGNGGGAIGRIGSGQATPTILLKNAEDVVNFEIGQKLVLSANDGSDTAHALRNGGNTVTVVGVDPSAGSVTVTGNWTASIAAAAADDYIFVDGDFKVKLRGFNAWNPITAPVAAESFYGVDRSVMPFRLAGWRYAGASGLSVEEAILKGLAHGRFYRSRPSTLLINPLDAQDLVNQLGSKVRYDRAQSSDRADIGFEAVVIKTPGGSIKVVEDPHCPRRVIRAVDFSTWKLATCGPCPDTLNDDGLMIARKATEDAYEVRMGLYGCIYCTDPSQNGVITLAA